MKEKKGSSLDLLIFYWNYFTSDSFVCCCCFFPTCGNPESQIGYFENVSCFCFGDIPFKVLFYSGIKRGNRRKIKKTWNCISYDKYLLYVLERMQAIYWRPNLPFLSLFLCLPSSHWPNPNQVSDQNPFQMLSYLTGAMVLVQPLIWMVYRSCRNSCASKWSNRRVERGQDPRLWGLISHVSV